MHRLDEDSAVDLWRAFVTRHPEHDGEEWAFERFGDNSPMADELLELVLHGRKRATAGAVVEFHSADEPLPRIGGHWVVADGRGRARAVLRSVELRLGPLESVDDAFAWDEGEGDRSRADWLRAHREYFRRACARLGVEFSDRLEVVFERFTVVWPPGYADTRAGR